MGKQDELIVHWLMCTWLYTVSQKKTVKIVLVTTLSIFH